MNIEESAVVLGLPGSGKTTFLAAMWDIIVARSVDETALSFGALRAGNASHLNKIAKRWREGKEQDRTELGGNLIVQMTLKVRGRSEQATSLTFPDIAGEAYRSMWEERVCERSLVEYLRAPSVVLFIHADRIRLPRWAADETSMAKKLGLAVSEQAVVPWNPRDVPTQVALVDLLQLLQEQPLSVGRRRLSIVLSAWEKVSDEGLKPHEFLAEKLPLLRQYLDGHRDAWVSQVFGVSAQGGEYQKVVREGEAEVLSAETEALLELYNPSDRIQVWGHSDLGHDITIPLAWALGAA